MQIPIWLATKLIIGLIGVLLILARKYKNSDQEAGSGIAFWTLLMIIITDWS